jgi:hypothetical protein
MKTAASSTKNVSKEIANAKKVIAAAATYISQWTEHELNNISKSEKMPYIWPIEGLGYVIGHYRVLNNKGAWQVRSDDNKLLYIFTEKLSAIFYVLCEETKRYGLSRNLLLADQTVNKLRNDVVYYEASIKRAKSIKDYDKVDIWKARLGEANLKLKVANQELRKSVNTAKYIKYWE